MTVKVNGETILFYLSQIFRGPLAHFDMKKVCAVRESNPKLNLGRVTCYHYTNGAVTNNKVIFTL